jgi:hypothetical protein
MRLIAVKRLCGYSALAAASLVASACGRESVLPTVHLAVCESCGDGGIRTYSTNTGGHPGAPEITIAQFTTTVGDVSGLGGRVVSLTIQFQDAANGESGVVYANEALLRAGVCRSGSDRPCDIEAAATTMVPPAGQLVFTHSLRIPLDYCPKLSIQVTAAVEDGDGNATSAMGTLAMARLQC